MLTKDVQTVDETVKNADGKKDKSWWDREGYVRSESEEYIVRTTAEAMKVPKLEVWETKEFEIDREESMQFATDAQDPNAKRMYDGGDKNTTTVTVTKPKPIANGMGS